MIAIFCLIFASRTFYSTAIDKGRSGNLWAVLCFVTYFLAQIIFGALLGLLGKADDLGTMELNLLGILIGAVSLFVLYIVLKNLSGIDEDSIDATLD